MRVMQMGSTSSQGGARPIGVECALSKQAVLTPFRIDHNPGALIAKKFVPADLKAYAPLVVVLHGCTQTPETYDRGTGWTRQAERHGFAVLFPEQQRSNNMNTCFNWFEAGDMRRGEGEAASIKSMIDRMIADHDIDPARVFITGLSAGAAMAGVMLATYPEVFAGGGLIAGIPYGVARSMPAAFSRMRSAGPDTDVQLAALVRSASPHDGPWPTISVWHGTADMTVSASNADATVAQWRGVHRLTSDPAVEDRFGNHPYRAWRDSDGRTCVEEYLITGMGHGTPLDTGGPERFENAGAYLLDVGLSSTECLLASWGISETEAAASSSATLPASLPLPAPLSSPSRARDIPKPAQARLDVQQIIEDALRSAGLMR